MTAFAVHFHCMQQVDHWRNLIQLPYLLPRPSRSGGGTEGGGLRLESPSSLGQCLVRVQELVPFLRLPTEVGLFRPAATKAAFAA